MNITFVGTNLQNEVNFLKHVRVLAEPAYPLSGLFFMKIICYICRYNVVLEGADTHKALLLDVCVYQVLKKCVKRGTCWKTEERKY